MQRLSSFLVLLGTTALISACGGSQSGEATTTTTTTRTASSSGGDGSSVIRLSLHADIRAACSDIQTPTLEFDSGDTEPSHRAAFRPLASCMNQPGNQSRRFMLIGHTDPQGTAADNAQLGMGRANAVRDMLVSFGVSADRLEITSRGEMTSQGTTPDEWPAERRVEIEFVPAS